MKRAPVAALLASLVLAVAAPAAGQTVVSNETDPDRFRSPQRFALEFRFGPYSPNIDDEFADPTTRPHAEFFKDKTRIMSQVELDFQLFRRFGTAAVGLSLGYFRENEKAVAELMAGRKPNYSDESRTADNSRLSLYPIALLAVYRADQLFRRYGIPVIPYGKLGFNYTIWSVYDADGEVVEANGTRARGGTRGWQAAVGVSLVLDFIDPGAARALDSETGVNHTHAFFELARFEVDGLGQDDKLNVGDSTWLAGLMFEF